MTQPIVRPIGKNRARSGLPRLGGIPNVMITWLMVPSNAVTTRAAGTPAFRKRTMLLPESADLEALEHNKQLKQTTATASRSHVSPRQGSADLARVALAPEAAPLKRITAVW